MNCVSGVGSGGVGGASARPKVLLSKIRAKSLGKIAENLAKTLKYLGTVPEYLGKNDAQRCLT